MARVEKSIEVNVPPEKIWPLVKWENVPEVFESLKKMEWTSEEHNKVGSTLHLTTEVAGVKQESDVEITDWVENEKAGWRTIGGNAKIIFSSTFSPTKNGTKVTFTQDYELPYSILGKIIDKLRFHKAIEKDTENALIKLKAMAEKQ